MRRLSFYRSVTQVVLLACIAVIVPVVANASGSFIGPFSKVVSVASTVPGNGDINPYGVAVVRRSTGSLVEGDVLVSNFNNAANQQGTGTSIVEVARDGTTTLFAQINAANLPGACPGGVGLTTALVVLLKGWVIVGSLSPQLTAQPPQLNPDAYSY